MGGSGKIAAATAGNRPILVHSGFTLFPHRFRLTRSYGKARFPCVGSLDNECWMLASSWSCITCFDSTNYQLTVTPKPRERKLNTNFFFSNFVGTAGISRQNPGISQQTILISLVSRDIPNFLAPTRSRGRSLPKRKISGLKSLGLGSFLCLKTWEEPSMDQYQCRGKL